MKRLHALTLLPAVLLLVTGCGGSDSESSGSLPAVSETAPEPAPPAPTDLPAEEPEADPAGDTVVFVWTETGGCAQGGPNCARYEITVDGTVETFRDGADAETGPEATGSIDPMLVQAWSDAVNNEDLDALRERVGEGELTAAFDGVDYLLANPATGVELSSVETAFDETEPVFSAAVALAEAARTAAPLELEMR